MTLSMYQASVPTITRALNNLIGVLEKGAQSCEARKIDPAVLLNARLAPDMFPLAKQVQIASDTAKAACARLAQQQAPAFEDNEKSFAELVERLRRTIAYLETLEPARSDSYEDPARVTLERGREPRAAVRPLLSRPRALRNRCFHCTTAYAILRHNGVDVGKRDFLGKL